MTGWRRGVRLAVDVGQARVGLAACDPDGILASPVETLARDADGASDLDRIVREAAERDAVEVLVGLPLSLSGQVGPAARTCREFAETLAARLKTVPVRLVDERLSTVDAHRALRAAGRPGRKQRQVVDQVAAVLLLESAIRAEKETGRPPGELVQQEGDGEWET